ncbi:uncharacterized protein LOC117790725 isoform X1 [Drosophila innubila]|uniref:uncharacterized protein LOC117790725 isoform X1 n=1 Tax=Drosophila innubila TaxID=198719 RepID=UPI00148D5D56|nr:uncharacterized protein LOC117790725 isoform X1 [Drosophila innubila]
MSPNIDDFNADELNAPDWMNEQFFKEVLIKHIKDPNVKVVNVKTSPATAKGDHYASIMFRANVEYSTQKEKFSKSLIIKTMPDPDSDKNEVLGDSHIFPTEIAMYTEVLPKFEAILAEAGDEITFCARCIYHSLEPRQVMVFEDLVSQNYDVIRNRPANLDEIKAGLEKLAKWQAVSFKLLKEKSVLFDKLQYDVTTIPNFLEHELLTSGFPNFLDALESVSCLKQYRKYFEPMKDIIIKRWVEIIREYRDNQKDDAYYVLCHGDFHLKNMMFRGNDCMLLDFQLSYVGSMTNDVLYAMYMFLGPEERRHNYDELIYHYFACFTRTLSKIGYQGMMPSLVEYRKQLFDRRYLEIFLMSTFMATFNHMRKGQDPSEFINDADKRRQLYNDKDYQEELKYLLPRFLHLGYFDQLK